MENKFIELTIDDHLQIMINISCIVCYTYHESSGKTEIIMTTHHGMNGAIGERIFYVDEDYSTVKEIIKKKTKK